MTTNEFKVLTNDRITAVILAAGESKRMGQSKMLLPWGNSTVLGHVITVCKESGIEDILVVTGKGENEVDRVAKSHLARTVFNADFANGEMLSSLQAGLRELARYDDAHSSKILAALICLGDQPQVKEKIVKLLLQEYINTEAPLIVPSYQMRRGHPWLIARPLWVEIQAIKSPQSPRDFLNSHSPEIKYIPVETSSVIEDLDTPEDYQKFHV